MKIISAFILASSLAAGHVASAGEIIGTVTLKGTPPPENPNNFIKDDAKCAKVITEVPTTHFYVVGGGGELADVIVKLKDAPGKSAGASAQPVVLDQKNCQYVPQILAIQTGQTLLVRTSDPFPHNVRTKPATPGNHEENKMQEAGAPDVPLTFGAAENFLKFQCDVHSSTFGSWMLAWVTVVDHPYFAVTGKDGKFKISNVPAGKYTLTALHRKAALNGVDKQIEVKEGEPAKVDFTLEVPAAPAK
jgi:plastocyanin